MVLDENNILQADATVIAGVLIILSIAYTVLPRPKEIFKESTWSQITKIPIVLVVVVILFSASAIIIVFANTSTPMTRIIPIEHPEKLVEAGKFIMILGFLALAIGIIWLVVPMTKKFWTYTQKEPERK